MHRALNSPHYRVLLAMACIISLTLGILSQTNDDTRGLIPKEYAAQLSQNIAKRRPRSNRRKPTGIVKYAPTSSGNSPMAPGVDIGVTFWRLRVARKADDPVVVEPKRIVKRIKNEEVESTIKLTPERVESEARFSDGEKLRVSIEAPFESYVYILNQEQYADGALSDPFLVYPGTVDIRRNSRAAPGQLVYIPEEPDYFEISSLNPGGKRKSGEIFTIVLSSGLIGGIPPLREAEDTRKIDQMLFDRLQRDWGGAAWKFQQIGGIRRNITRAEKKAGLMSGGALDEGDPQPQTVYHVARRADGIVAFQITVGLTQ